ncbi:enoyl-CoA hydratase/isomerase family protein [Brevibacterium renqingii]|uniref:enoyl-CoA hydratase/isomerase family protein n=1 Tax=Brevibacterium renqingii TaxID=2776916 RepID=UPI001AE0B788|nr:enoyl-CoA hydratase/isomerase family protein [Brevibacterium renqingii]
MTNDLSAGTAVHPNLKVRDIGHVRILQIDREDKLGAFSSSLVSAIGREISRIRQTTSIRVVILTGTGRGFVAGADIEEYATASIEEFAEYQRRSRAVFDDLARLPQVTIAAVNGYAFGGGFEIALCCDFIFAAHTAKFGLPEIKLGLIPGGGGPQRLVREVGARWTKELVMTGRTVTANEANARGIVTQVVEREELDAVVIEFASTLAARPRDALREAKHVIDSGRSQDLETALTADQLALARLFGSEDGIEGIRAFVEKRSAEFDQN